MNTCENDCKIQCVGCYQIFCDIKEEYGLPHDEELPETIYLNCGDAYCHSDCLRDCR